MKKKKEVASLVPDSFVCKEHWAGVSLSREWIKQTSGKDVSIEEAREISEAVLKNLQEEEK